MGGKQAGWPHASVQSRRHNASLYPLLIASQPHPDSLSPTGLPPASAQGACQVGLLPNHASHPSDPRPAQPSILGFSLPPSPSPVSTTQHPIFTGRGASPWGPLFSTPESEIWPRRGGHTESIPELSPGSGPILGKSSKQSYH